MYETYIIFQLQLMLMCLFATFLGLTATTRYLCKVHLVMSILINVLLISLFFEYLECNRRLEYSNLVQLKTSEANPCEQTTSFFGLTSGYNAKKCADYMMTAHGHNRQICRPVDVFSEFGLELLFKPLSKLLETITDSMSQIYDKHGMWKGIPIVVGVLILLIYWMRSFLRVFVEGLLMWMGGSSSQTPPTNRNDQGTAIGAPPPPSVVNVNISIDPKAIGDYVQTVRNDEEKLRAAITLSDLSTEGSPVKQPIEDVSNGSEISSELEEVKKEK